MSVEIALETTRNEMVLAVKAKTVCKAKKSRGKRKVAVPRTETSKVIGINS